MPTEKDNGFHVRLDGIELSHEARERIQAGIQAVVMKELASFFPNPDDDGKPKHGFGHGGGVVVVPSKWWWGFILRQLQPKEIEGIHGLNEAINSKTLGGETR